MGLDDVTQSMTMYPRITFNSKDYKVTEIGSLKILGTLTKAEAAVDFKSYGASQKNQVKMFGDILIPTWAFRSTTKSGHHTPAHVFVDILLAMCRRDNVVTRNCRDRGGKNINKDGASTKDLDTSLK